MRHHRTGSPSPNPEVFLYTVGASFLIVLITIVTNLIRACGLLEAVNGKERPKHQLRPLARTLQSTL
jgi:hypothetical protein